MAGWEGGESGVCGWVRELSSRRLGAYQVNPADVEEHANIERSIVQGGYGRRQIYELVQNGADALLEAGSTGRIHVLLTPEALYCANEGAPIDVDGVGAILGAFVSRKRGAEIGRFGLGFKSVLSVSSSPEFYSRSGSFVFSHRQAAEEIRSVAPGVPRVPSLRVAFPVESVEPAFAADTILGELAAWATTIVKLPRDVDMLDDIADDLTRFPSEFLLFCPMVQQVVLEDRSASTRRELTVSREGDQVLVDDGTDNEIWRLFRTVYRPSERAKRDAGELSGRDELPLTWAVQTTGRRERGRFWAFFPTEDATTLSGIANAPWKTNEDRQSVLAGTFNIELLEAFSGLVADSLVELSDPDDPANCLELLPARGREAACWADSFLTATAYRVAAEAATLPDTRGRMRRPEELTLGPKGLSEAAKAEWLAAPTAPDGWVHPSVDRTVERRSRAERLIEDGGGRTAEVSDWLEALTDGTPSSSIAALRVAALLQAAPGAQFADTGEARIVLTSTGRWLPATPGAVYIGTGHASELAGAQFVHEEIASDEVACAALEALGVTRLDAAEELRAILGSRHDGRLDWSRVWAVVRRMPSEQALEVLRPEGPFYVKAEDGSFADLGGLLLPGKVVGSGESPSATIDTVFHAEELVVLKGLGAMEGPLSERGKVTEPWMEKYRAWALDLYRSERPNARSVALEVRAAPFPGPLQPLVGLTGAAAARFTALVMDLLAGVPKWTVECPGNPTRHPPLSVENGPWWMIREHGTLETSCGDRSIARCVGPGLSDWDEFFPVTDLDEKTVERLALPDSVEELTRDHWSRAFARATLGADVERIAPFYGFAAQHHSAPSLLRCRVSDKLAIKPPHEVTVAVHQGEVDALAVDGVPFLRVSDGTVADLLRERWGLRLPAAAAVTTEIVPVAAAEAVPLLDAFPALQAALPEDKRDLRLVRCTGLSRQTISPRGRSDEALETVLDGGVLFVSDRLEDREILVKGLGLAPAAADEVLQRREVAQRRDRRRGVMQAPDDAVRLLRLVGERALRSRLPDGLLRSVTALHGHLSGEDLAKLALSVHGTDVLKQFRRELERDGWGPPAQWAGSKAAVRFVRDLGFGVEYAGSAIPTLDRHIDVERPWELPPLHDFQRDIADAMKRVLSGEVGRRGLLAMPTGAGKTRVAVQSTIEHLVESGTTAGLVLWVAETHELCEQAVQTWEYVWREAGPRGQVMRISRLWEWRDAEEFRDGTHVVVGTISKLGVVLGDPSYAWLSRPTCAIIDEAHGSTEKSYTELLSWLGVEQRGAAQTQTPLVGLTATPFRGTNEAETERLAIRYARHRIDHGALPEDPYPFLQSRGVLARARHEVLEGTDLGLTPEEAAEVRQLSRLPSSVGDRLALDVERNQMILESIKALEGDWTVLLFATSVAHAETMAALLSHEGIPARPISAKTEAGMRRRSIEAFRKGEIRVLTNYGVLTQGFDAPAVRAVYVTRPTFSPNVYQQMIGRGLRGPKNGGKEECLIVDVADNVEKWGLRLAFDDYEYLWSGDRVPRPIGSGSSAQLAMPLQAVSGNGGSSSGSEGDEHVVSTGDMDGPRSTDVAPGTRWRVMERYFHMGLEENRVAPTPNTFDSEAAALSRAAELREHAERYGNEVLYEVRRLGEESNLSTDGFYYPAAPGESRTRPM